MSNAKKPDRKPIYVYILIVALAMLLINLFLFPAVRAQRYTEVDYSAPSARSGIRRWTTARSSTWSMRRRSRPLRFRRM